MVTIDISGVGFEERAPIAIRAASSFAFLFLYPLPSPSFLPPTVKNEYGTTDYQGEGPTEADRVPNAIVSRTLARDIPLEVVDHVLGLEQIVQPLAWVCGRSGEQIIKPVQRETNEASRFLTCGNGSCRPELHMSGVIYLSPRAVTSSPGRGPTLALNGELVWAQGEAKSFRCAVTSGPATGSGWMNVAEGGMVQNTPKDRIRRGGSCDESSTQNWKWR